MTGKKLSIILFCCIIGLPLLLFVLGMRGEAVDNRAPRRIPLISWEGVRSGKWFAAVNDYLIDHTPLREKAIAANAWIEWNVFRESSNPQVSQGRDGWLFLNNSLDHGCVPKAEIARRFQMLAAQAKAYKEKHGTRIVWVIAPNKEAIYPEMLTPVQTERARCATANRAAMREVLRDPALEPHIFGLWDALEEEKSERIFRRTDSHWNFKGAVIGMRVMLERIWPGIYRDGDFHPAETVDYQGDLGKMLGFADMRESETLWKPTRSGVTGGLSEQPVCMKTATARRRSFRHASTDAPLIPEKVVFLRDSFFDAPLHLVPPFFAQVDIGHVDHTPAQDWLAIATCADTLVIETVERSVLNRAVTFSERLSFETPLPAEQSPPAGKLSPAK